MAPSSSARVLVLAGEASGDAWAAGVVRALRGVRPGWSFLGTGGPALAAAGVHLMAGLDRMAVMGFAEVVRHLGFFRRLERRVGEVLRSGEVSLLLAVDYPGFNLRAARAARRCGVPVLYFVAPQVWAWKRRRARYLARDADHIATVLPFEPELFRAWGGEASFVGHPLADLPPPGESELGEIRREVGAPPDAPLLALLPGSRPQEIARHLALFAEVARRVVERQPGIRPVVAAAPGIAPGVLESAGLPVTPRTRGLLHAARAALVKSGTSTLEATLAGTPLVVAYRTSSLTYQVARRLVRVPHIALPNLIAGERVVPEFVQGAATAPALAQALQPLLESGGAQRDAMLRGLARVRSALGSGGQAVEQVARRAIHLVEGSR
ncbi:MAG: lipid-A-disaccharide synthase [Longimicrobiales bacterium]|nr:lipid-A-disaccharide synthase [Longimicrobiales bacterium]